MKVEQKSPFPNPGAEGTDWSSFSASEAPVPLPESILNLCDSGATNRNLRDCFTKNFPSKDAAESLLEDLITGREITGTEIDVFRHAMELAFSSSSPTDGL